MLDTLMSLLALTSIAAAAYGIGRPMVRALIAEEDDPIAIAVWSIAAGLVGAGLTLVVLGLLGLLSKAVIGVLTITAGFWGIGEISRGYLLRREIARLGLTKKSLLADASWTQPPRWMKNCLVALAWIAAGGSLTAALAPPTAGDALCYHLELPKRFLAQRALVHLPDNDNSAYPLLVEMWYLWALALDGGVAAQLVHWGLGLLLALATAALATPILGRSWGVCSGCLILLVPGINNQMTAPLNDVGLAVFTTLALAAWRRAALDDESPRWFVLAGWMLGGAMSIKHLALVYAAAVATTAAWHAWRRPEQRQRLLSGAAMLAVVAVSVSGIWYLRAAVRYRNPVYPFFHQQLAGQGRPTLPADKAPLGRNPLALIAAPWQLTMHPDRLGGRSHQLGLLFLATLPGLFFCRRLRGIGTLLWIALAYFVGWFFLRQNVRFLFPLAPLLCVPVLWVWIEARRLPRLPGAIFVAVSAAMLCSAAGVAAARGTDKAAVVLGVEGRQEYLQRHEPTYLAAAWANAALPPNAHILSQEHRAFYFNSRVTRENIYRRRTGYDRRLSSPAALGRQLREAGFTHLLLAESLNDSGVRYNDSLSRMAVAALSSGKVASLEVLTDYRFEDRDGAVRRYRLIALR